MIAEQSSRELQRLGRAYARARCLPIDSVAPEMIATATLVVGHAVRPGLYRDHAGRRALSLPRQGERRQPVSFHAAYLGLAGHPGKCRPRCAHRSCDARLRDLPRRRRLGCTMSRGLTTCRRTSRRCSRGSRCMFRCAPGACARHLARHLCRRTSRAAAPAGNRAPVHRQPAVIASSSAVRADRQQLRLKTDLRNVLQWRDRRRVSRELDSRTGDGVDATIRYVWSLRTIIRSFAARCARRSPVCWRMLILPRRVLSRI